MAVAKQHRAIDGNTQVSSCLPSQPVSLVEGPGEMPPAVQRHRQETIRKDSAPATYSNRQFPGQHLSASKIAPEFISAHQLINWKTVDHRRDGTVPGRRSAQTVAAIAVGIMGKGQCTLKTGVPNARQF